MGRLSLVPLPARHQALRDGRVRHPDLADGRCRWALGRPSRTGGLPPTAARCCSTASTSAGPARLPTGATYPEVRRDLAVGEGLLLYTDGLVERRGEDIDAGPALVTALDDLAGEPTRHLCDRLMEVVAGGHEGRDDVCQLLIRRRA